MMTLTIEIPDKVEKTVTDLIAQLGGKVVVTEPSVTKSEKDGKKLTRKEKEFLKGFDESIEFINLYKAGKVKATSIEELLSEL